LKSKIIAMELFKNVPLKGKDYFVNLAAGQLF